MNRIIKGNCLDVLPTLESGSINTCVTSPPYWGLRDYGVDGQIGAESSPAEFIDSMVNVFEGVHRVLRDDGTLWLNLGDCYYNYRPGKGQSMVKQSISNTKQDLPDKCARRGTKLDGLKEKDLIGIPWRVAFALQDFGWYLRQDIIWSKPNPMPESVKDRCTKAHEYIFLFSKSKNYYFDSDVIKEPTVTSDNLFRDRETTKCNNTTVRKRMGGLVHNNYEKRNKRSVWNVQTQPFSGAHFATFPPELIEPCILAGSPKGGVVLDPFFGAGTTGLVANRNNRQYVGIELNPEYIKLAEQRIANDAGMFNNMEVKSG